MKAPYLIVMIPGREPLIHYLNAQTIVIGRDPRCDIHVDSVAVSRRHCELTRFGSTYRIKDMNTSNKTFINGAEIHEQILKTGDHIFLGIVKVVFTNPLHAIADDEPAAGHELEATRVPPASESNQEMVATSASASDPTLIGQPPAIPARQQSTVAQGNLTETVLSPESQQRRQTQMTQRADDPASPPPPESIAGIPPAETAAVSTPTVATEEKPTMSSSADTPPAPPAPSESSRAIETVADAFPAVAKQRPHQTQIATLDRLLNDAEMALDRLRAAKETDIPALQKSLDEAAHLGRELRVEMDRVARLSSFQAPAWDDGPSMRAYATRLTAHADQYDAMVERHQRFLNGLSDLFASAKVNHRSRKECARIEDLKFRSQDELRAAATQLPPMELPGPKQPREWLTWALSQADEELERLQKDLNEHFPNLAGFVESCSLESLTLDDATAATAGRASGRRFAAKSEAPAPELVSTSAEK